MVMTVKKLIAELEKIENKFLEVEIMSPSYSPWAVDRVVKPSQQKKVFLVSEKYLDKGEK
jgi:hypothetical protein